MQPQTHNVSTGSNTEFDTHTHTALTQLLRLRTGRRWGSIGLLTPTHRQPALLCISRLIPRASIAQFLVHRLFGLSRVGPAAMPLAFSGHAACASVLVSLFLVHRLFGLSCIGPAAMPLAFSGHAACALVLISLRPPRAPHDSSRRPILSPVVVGQARCPSGSTGAFAMGALLRRLALLRRGSGQGLDLGSARTAISSFRGSLQLSNAGPDCLKR